MKKWIFTALLVALIGSQVTAQEKEVVYGTVRTDGYQKITRGALWSKRPEAKKIFEGSVPTGFKVYTLESEYFVRFVDDEHNKLDRNYIVFPAGEKVYTNENGQYFAAICGNRIDYLRPVDLVKIVEVEVEKEKFLPPKKETTYDLNFKSTVVDKGVPNLYFPPVPKEQKKIKVWVFVVPLAAIIGGGVYLLTKKKNSSIPMDNGGPGGAPVTRPVVVPPVVPPVNPGGPGGAPTTK